MDATYHGAYPLFDVQHSILNHSILNSVCLIFIAYQDHPRYPLILAANRDEFHHRPTAAAAFWEGAPHVLAGKDLEGGGTWLGVTRNGRFAALTNYRDPDSNKNDTPSRGLLVSEYLVSEPSALDYLQGMAKEGARYNGFNLLLGDTEGLFYYSNQLNETVRLSPGVYGLSNHLLDTEWPKLQRGKAALERAFAKEDLTAERLLELLSDRVRPDDTHLPNTGVGIEWERFLSPIFISGSEYGTRSSTVVLVDADGHTRFVERSFASNARYVKTSSFGLRLATWQRTFSSHAREIKK